MLEEETDSDQNFSCEGTGVLMKAATYCLERQPGKRPVSSTVWNHCHSEGDLFAVFTISPYSTKPNLQLVSHSQW